MPRWTSGSLASYAFPAQVQECWLELGRVHLGSGKSRASTSSHLKVPSLPFANGFSQHPVANPIQTRRPPPETRSSGSSGSRGERLARLFFFFFFRGWCLFVGVVSREKPKEHPSFRDNNLKDGTLRPALGPRLPAGFRNQSPTRLHRAQVVARMFGGGTGECASESGAFQLANHWLRKV